MTQSKRCSIPAPVYAVSEADPGSTNSVLVESASEYLGLAADFPLIISRKVKPSSATFGDVFGWSGSPQECRAQPEFAILAKQAVGFGGRYCGFFVCSSANALRPVFWAPNEYADDRKLGDGELV